jgi:hypothetical protein
MVKGQEDLEAAREECINYLPKEDIDPENYLDSGCENYRKIPNIKIEGIFWCGACKNRTRGYSLFEEKITD